MIRLVIVDDMPDIRNYLAEELAAASEQFSLRRMVQKLSSSLIRSCRTLS